MSNEKECYNCFYLVEKIGRYEYTCRKTHRRTEGGSYCGYFLDEEDPSAHAC